MDKCIICNGGIEEIARGGYTAILFMQCRDGRYAIVAEGEDDAVYYPKFCPECGRRLAD